MNREDEKFMFDLFATCLLNSVQLGVIRTIGSFLVSAVPAQADFFVVVIDNSIMANELGSWK
jgi:hypothetical protein